MKLIVLLTFRQDSLSLIELPSRSLSDAISWDLASSYKAVISRRLTISSSLTNNLKMSETKQPDYTSSYDAEKDAGAGSHVTTSEVHDFEPASEEREVFKATADGENYRTVSWYVQNPT
jgi:hypothetical protein